MSINMILAVSNNLAIGDTNSPDGLPWSKNPDDMKFFKEMTTGNVVVMGGNTFRQLQEIGFEEGLPNRSNYILSSTVPENDFEVVYNLRGTCRIMVGMERLKAWFYHWKPEDKIFIIGGKSIYDQLHTYCHKVYLTRINQDFPDADVRINLDFLEDFKIVDKIPLNDYSEVEVWERK